MAHKQHYLDGAKIPSVTTITGRYGESGGLKAWANQIGMGTHRACEFQPPCPTCHRRPGLTTWEAIKRPADIGSLAHALIDEAICGRAPDPQEFAHIDAAGWKAAANCLEGFFQWRDANQVEFTAAELPLVSKRYRFSGVLDALGRMGDDKRYCLIDWKTADSWYVNNLAQLGGYLVLLEEHGYPEVNEIHLLRISKKNLGFDHIVRSRQDYQIAVDYFLQSRALYALEDGMKGLVK